MVKELKSPKEFDDILKRDGLTVVHFNLEDVPSILDEVSAEYSQVEFIMVDGNEYPELVMEYVNDSFFSLSSVIFILNGKVVETYIDAYVETFEDEYGMTFASALSKYT